MKKQIIGFCGLLVFTLLALSCGNKSGTTANDLQIPA